MPGWNTCYGDGGPGYAADWGDLTDAEIEADARRHATEDDDDCVPEVKWFRVEVSDHKGCIVAIEPGMLAGRDIGESEAATIREAIEHLTGFVGLPADGGSKHEG